MTSIFPESEGQKWQQAFMGVSSSQLKESRQILE